MGQFDTIFSGGTTTDFSKNQFGTIFTDQDEFRKRQEEERKRREEERVKTEQVQRQEEQKKNAYLPKQELAKHPREAEVEKKRKEQEVFTADTKISQAQPQKKGLLSSIASFFGFDDEWTTRDTIELQQESAEDLKKAEIKEKAKESANVFDQFGAGVMSAQSLVQSTSAVVARRLGAEETARKLDIKAAENKELKREFDREYRKLFVDDKYSVREKMNAAPVRYVAGLVADAAPITVGIGAASLGTGAAAVTLGAPAVAVTAIGTTTALGLGGVFAFGAGYQEAREFGVEEKEAEKLGLLVALTTAPFEALPQVRLLSKLPGGAEVKRQLSQSFSRNVARMLSGGGRSFFTQGLQEGSTEVTQTVVENAWARTYDENRDLFEGVQEAGLAGFFSGGIMDTLVSSTTSLHSSIKNLTEEGVIEGPNGMIMEEQESEVIEFGVLPQEEVQAEVAPEAPPQGENILRTMVADENSLKAAQEKIRKGEPLTPTDQALIATTGMTVEEFEAEAKKSAVTPEQQENLQALQAAVEQYDTPEAFIEAVEKGEIPQEYLSALGETNEDPIFQEARKYKSAEEFVKAQPTYYHTTSAESAKKIEQGGFKPQIGDRSMGVANAKGTWLYEDVSPTSEFGKNFKNPATIDAKVTGKIFDATNDERSIRGVVEDKELLAKLKNEGYVGVKGDELGTTATFIFDNNALKTKSQLTDIYNQATQATEKVIGKGVIQAQATIKEINEARKYKSAEEFVKSKTVTLYHGGNTARGTGSIGELNKGTFLTDNPSYAKLYSGDRGASGKAVVYKVEVPIDAISKTEKPNEFVLNRALSAKDAKQLGYADLANESASYVKSDILTKSQLTDIYNQAKGKEPMFRQAQLDEALVARLTDFYNKNKKPVQKPVVKEVAVPRRQLPVGEGAERASRLESRVRGLLSNLSEQQIDDIGPATYRQMNKQEQIKKASEFVVGNPKEAMAVLRGEKDAPPGLLVNSIAVAMQNNAVGDVELALRLGSLQATKMGQEISILTEIDPNSPVKAIESVIRIREEVAQKRLGRKKKLSTEKKRIAKEIKAQRKAPSKETWNSFISSLEC